MGVKKITYYGTELVNHSGATVDATTLAKGVKAWDAKGDLITGELEAEAGGEYDAVSVSNGDGTQTLRITTAGSGSGGGDSDVKLLTKTITIEADTSQTVEMFSKNELIEAGFTDGTKSVTDSWESCSIEFRAISLAEYKVSQLLRAYASSTPTIINESVKGDGFKATASNRNGSPSISWQWTALTEYNSTFIFEHADGTIRYYASSTVKATRGTYEATIIAHGRK